MTCLDENTVARLLARTLDPAREAQAHEHLAGCATCRQVVAQLLAAAEPPGHGASSPSWHGGSVAEAPPLLARGAQLGRYQIEDVHGVGGMGVVYVATDTTLRRKVALKLLRATASVEARERLLLEARALARLSHPCVVAVHDAALEADPLYLAMEWIDGQTLRAWLSAEPRPLGAVLDAFTAAGRGLAAIHAAGLVHRDFKPDNVLIGADSRVRVADLGLALEADTERPADAAGSGTPAYMAPEQRRGESVGPAQDQFSFCVALVEALSGRRPEPGTPGAALAVPKAMQAALARGLEREPQSRHPSMQALLEALERARRAPLRRAALAAAAMLLAGVAGAFGWRAAHDDCRSIGSQLDQVWDAGRRAQLATALGRFGNAGQPSAERVLVGLDARAAEWRAAKEASCSRDTTDALTAQLERQCLQDRRQELRVLVEVLQQATEQAFVTKASDAIDMMLRATACPRQAMARRRLPPPPDHEQAAVVEVRESLALARALASGGDYSHALERAQAALTRAKSSAWPPLALEALAELAAIEDQAGKLDDAVKDFSAAGYAAEAQGNDEVASAAWCSLVLVAGYRQGRAEMARHFAALGRAVLERAPDQPGWEACLRQNTALLAIREGHHGDAARDMQIAVEKAAQVYTPEDPHTLRALGVLGSALGELGRHDEALKMRQRALDGTERAKGKDHPDAAVAHLRVAESLLALGRRDEALRHADVAVDRQAALVGEKHFRYGIARCIRGSIRSEKGDDAEALADLEAGLQAIRAQQPADSIFVVQPLVALAEALDRAGRHAEAVANGQQAVALLDKKLEAPNPQTAYALGVLGQARLATGDAASALTDLERAAAIYLHAGEDCDPAHAARVTAALDKTRAALKGTGAPK